MSKLMTDENNHARLYAMWTGSELRVSRN